MGQKQVISKDGKSIKLDTSDERCKEFGFLAGQKVINIRDASNEAIVLGVGKPAENFQEVLFW